MVRTAGNDYTEARRVRVGKDRLFQDIVSDDVRGRGTEEDAAFLRLPDNLDKFYDELIDMVRSLDMQLSKQKIMSLESRQEALANGTMRQWEIDHLKVLNWRRSIQRVRRQTENRIREIKAIRRSQINLPSGPLLEAAKVMYKHISSHYGAYMSDLSDEEMNIHDENLWATLRDPNVVDLGHLLELLPE